MIHGSTTRTCTPQKFYKNISYTLPRLDKQMYKRPSHQTNSPYCTLPNNPLKQPTMSQASSQTSSRLVSPTLFEQLQADYPWPSLQYPERTLTPQLARQSQPMPVHDARTHKNWQMASTHAVMVAQFMAILHWPLEHIIQQFGQRTPVMEMARLLVARGPTSPEPLPVPPCVGTPYPSPRIQGLGTPCISMPAYSPPPPDYRPHSPTPSIEDITKLMTAGALVAAQTQVDRQMPSPTGPQPGVHPGPGWECNQNAGGIQYMFLIPDEGEGREVAPFIQVDGDTDYPKLMATQGRGCNIHMRALRAIPNPYPRPQFTRKEEFLFQDHESFTPLVDQAIHLEGNSMLAAEV